MVDLLTAEERQVSVDGTLKYENVYFWRRVKKDLSHSANQKGFFLKACTLFSLKGWHPLKGGFLKVVHRNVSYQAVLSFKLLLISK